MAIKGKKTTTRRRDRKNIERGAAHINQPSTTPSLLLPT